MIYRAWAKIPDQSLSKLGDKSPTEYGISDISVLLGQYAGLIFNTVIFATIIMLLWGALLYLTAYGNEEKAQKGKNTVVWAIIGLAVAIIARVIVAEAMEVLTGSRTTLPLP